VKNIEKSNTKTYSSENGQTLVFVVLVLFVLFGMLALVLDGGMAYAQRRTAQNAADAGALAGVVYLCESSTNQIMAETAAIEYAGRNSVNDVLVSFPATRQIEVEASVTFSTFFMSIFGQPEITATASAAAGCGNPGGMGGLLPLAFPCPTPVPGSASEDCGIVFGPENMVILMESNSSEYYCEPDGPINCDVDGDGIPDIIDTANRGWIDFDGNASETGDNTEDRKRWIDGSGVYIHSRTWLAGTTGVSTEIFKYIRDRREGEIVSIPIFDLFCDAKNGTPPLPEYSCPLIYNSDAPTYYDTTIPRNGTDLYYRIVGFSYFHITCVHAEGEDKVGSISRCPFRNEVIPSPGTNSVKSIEGYYVEGPADGGGGGDGYDAGLYIPRLTR
jgi:hypothetical protein